VERFASLNVSETARFVEVTAAWARRELGLAQQPPVFPQAHRLTEATVAELAGDFTTAARLWRGRNARGELRALWASNEHEALLEAEQRAAEAGFEIVLRQIRRSLRQLGEHRSAPRVAAGELTAREREVLDLVGAGLTNLEIARRLGLSRATVAEHVSEAARKLGAHSRAQAAALALRQ
jgi:DNA-binding CsgD family transcriptional regulator